jgi:CheY-like chemotaxis protein
MLLDLCMPGMDDTYVLWRIRPKPSPLPVAVLTAVSIGGNTIEAMRPRRPIDPPIRSGQ